MIIFCVDLLAICSKSLRSKCNGISRRTHICKHPRRPTHTMSYYIAHAHMHFIDEPLTKTSHPCLHLSLSCCDRTDSDPGPSARSEETSVSATLFARARGGCRGVASSSRVCLPAQHVCMCSCECILQAPLSQNASEPKAAALTDILFVDTLAINYVHEPHICIRTLTL